MQLLIGDLGVKRVKKAILIAALMVGGISSVSAHQEEEPNEREVTPADLEREEITVPFIDTENAEIMLLIGAINFDNFNTRGAMGASLAYHVDEDWFIEATYLESEMSDFEYRSLGASQAPSVDEPVYYTSLNVGMNMLPGEIYLLDKYALSSTFYLIAGLGSMNFADDDKFTFNFGFGYRVYLNDWISLRLEARDHVFKNTIVEEEEFRHNFEFRFGVSMFF